ncbi:MAG TPA: hypothetical protein VFZ49_00730 [Pyrinomonadaceae bacterium]
MIISRIGKAAFSVFLLAVSGFVFTVEAQQFFQDLNGFRLGQLRSVTQRELGAPEQAGPSTEDVVFEAFLLKEEPQLYMVFQYRKDEPDRIWSIQMTGEDPLHDPSFKDLRLGLPASEVEKRLGKPFLKENVGEHGTRWEYAGRNFSVETNPQSKLSSIRIVNDRSKDPDVKNMPRFSDVVKQLQTPQNSDLAEFLAPDLELYEGGKTRSFTWRMATEIASDKSGVFAAIRRLSKELSTVDSTKPDQYEEKLKLHRAREAQHVIRLPKLTGVTEIVFRWNGERWQIWEFGAKPAAPVPSDWKSIYKPGTLKGIVTERIPALIRQPNVALNKSDGKPHASFSYNSYPTSAAVKFTGESRKISDTTQSLISIWLETLGKSKDLAKRFEFEFKYIEDGVEYWIPTQHPLPERFSKEVKSGESITIYLAWVGIEFENSTPKMLAIVNEFTNVQK